MLFASLKKDPLCFGFLPVQYSVLLKISSCSFVSFWHL